VRLGALARRAGSAAAVSVAKGGGGGEGKEEASVAIDRAEAVADMVGPHCIQSRRGVQCNIAAPGAAPGACMPCGCATSCCPVLRQQTGQSWMILVTSPFRYVEMTRPAPQEAAASDPRSCQPPACCKNGARHPPCRGRRLLATSTSATNQLRRRQAPSRPGASMLERSCRMRASCSERGAQVRRRRPAFVRTLSTPGGSAAAPCWASARARRSNCGIPPGQQAGPRRAALPSAAGSRGAHLVTVPGGAPRRR
jgi:hypothetical protein